MSKKMSNEDKLALMDSEVYQEMEAAELVKYAQVQKLVKYADSLADKIVQSPTTQKAITDGVAKALDPSKADDGAMESIHEELKGHISKLSDHELFEMFKFFANELETRGIDADAYEEQFEDEEAAESPEDEIEEEKDMEAVMAFVKSSLTKLAYSAADKGNTEAAYLIERCLQKIS